MKLIREKIREGSQEKTTQTEFSQIDTSKVNTNSSYSIFVNINLIS